MLDLQVLFCVLIGGAAQAVIRPSSTLYPTNGEGFIAYLEVAKSFGAVKNCWYKYRDEEKTQLDLNTSLPITTARNEIVLPFSGSVCGVRVNQVSAASAATWTLEVESIYGDVERDYVTISILPAGKTRFDTHVQLDAGKATIRCTKHETYTKYCKIIDGSDIVVNQCELSTTVRGNQSFECLTSNWGRLEESHETIYVDIREPVLQTSASVEDSAASIILRCLYNDVAATHSCQAEMPNRTDGLFIMDGLYNGRYSTYDTLASKAKCSLEIPKPLDSTDIGLWRIMNYNAGIATGCLFYVGRSKDTIIANELQELVTRTKVVRVYAPEDDTAISQIGEINCVVPFVVEDCFLRDPNNTVYFADSFKFQKYRLYGKCAFDNVPIIAGIWVCGARGRDYETEVLQHIEVRVQPKGGELLADRVTAVRGGNAVELMCRSAFEEPISHCAFTNLLGQVFLVGTVNSIKTAGHVQYFGRGIEYGECGIKISAAGPDDFGPWKCQFVSSGNVRSTFVIEVVESVTVHASSVGMGVGITVIVVLVLGVAVGTVFYRRRNKSARHNFVSADVIDMTGTLDSSTATTQA